MMRIGGFVTVHNHSAVKPYQSPKTGHPVCTREGSGRATRNSITSYLLYKAPRGTRLPQGQLSKGEPEDDRIDRKALKDLMS